MYFAHDDRQKVCLAGESRTKFDSPEFCDGDGKASNPSAVGYGLWVAKVVSFRQLFALHFADGRQLGTIHGRTSPMRVANARCVVGREPGRKRCRAAFFLYGAACDAAVPSNHVANRDRRTRN